jgi:hypothetical protein
MYKSVVLLLAEEDIREKAKGYITKYSRRYYVAGN